MGAAIQPGAWQHDRRTRRRCEQPFTVAATASAQPVIVGLERRVEVSGRVLTSDGAGAADMFVMRRIAGSVIGEGRAPGSAFLVTISRLHGEPENDGSVYAGKR